MMSLFCLLVRRFRDYLPAVLLALAPLSPNFSQSQLDYTMSLSNGVKVNYNTIEFDITIKSTSSSFTLTSYQCSFLFNCSIANGGELSFNYIEGSSQLNNLPTLGVGINTCDAEPKLTFAAMPGSDIVTDSNTLVGRFRLTSTNAFADLDPNIIWNFDGYVATIVMGDNFQNITNPTSHINNLKLSTKSINSEIPTDYQLYQNYPNPFNPSTTIRFALKTEGDVKLTVYNMLGELVKELINEKVAAGSHEFAFNSDNLPSGSYVYRLEANNEYIGAKKMVLLK